MMEPSDKEKAELAMKRHLGMDPNRAKSMTEVFMRQNDLYWQCPDCGQRIQGTFEHLMEKVCDCAKPRS